MNIARSSMRLVREEGSPPARLPLPPMISVLDQLTSLQDEIQTLQAEVNSLRRRDETLRFYMHRLDEELRLAARIQQDFLPKFLPQVGPIHFHSLFRPAGYVSGDLYDVMRLDEEHIGFFVCDAVGHGMPAALLTMFIKRALITKEILPSGYHLFEPSETLAHLNSALVDQALSQASYATALYGIINTKTLKVRFSRGGHPSPAVLRKDGAIEFPDASGALLGIFPDEVFSVTEIQMSLGDRLFIYSDGVEVAFCGSNILETHLWQDELLRRRHLPTEQLLQEMSEELDRQTGSLQPRDDLTIIAMDVR
jgi:sigma-B regulation protein RsbU (phosphoserine phosphatase)